MEIASVRRKRQAMLLKSYSFETSLPECNTFAETLNAIASLPEDIGEALPYLASVIKLCTYDDNTKILTFKRDGKGIAIYPRQAESLPPHCASWLLFGRLSAKSPAVSSIYFHPQFGVSGTVIAQAYHYLDKANAVPYNKYISGY